MPSARRAHLHVATKMGGDTGLQETPAVPAARTTHSAESLCLRVARGAAKDIAALKGARDWRIDERARLAKPRMHTVE